MMSDLQDKVDQGHKPKKIEKGRMVCAKYSKDGEFYRYKLFRSYMWTIKCSWNRRLLRFQKPILG